MNFKSKSKEEKRQFILVIIIVVLLLLMSILVPQLFPGTKTADIINNSVGKFFNLFTFFGNNYVIIIESVTIVFFVWLINKALLLLVSLLKGKSFRS